MVLVNIISFLLGIYLYKKLFRDYIFKKLFPTKEEQCIGLSQILKTTHKETHIEVTTTKTETVVNKLSKPNIIYYGRPVVGTELSFRLDSSDVFGVTTECIDGYDDGYGIYKEIYCEDSTQNILSCKMPTPYRSTIHYNISTRTNQ